MAKPIELLLDGVAALRAWQQRTGTLIEDLLRYGGRSEAKHNEILDLLRSVYDRAERTDQRVGIVTERLPHLATGADVRARPARGGKESVLVETLRAEVDALRERLLQVEQRLDALAAGGVLGRLLLGAPGRAR